jgi:signal transduction histidine kinase/CheY-like chemotaxis protein
MQQDVTICHDISQSILPYLVEPDEAARDAELGNWTVVNVPLVARGDLVGGLALRTRRRTPAERELDVLRGFAAQAASAIANARLCEDLRAAYDDIRIIQEELAQSFGLRALGERAGSVAHDVNNILLAIVGHAQLAQQQGTEAAARHALGVIERAALDGSQVVRRIQSMARGETLPSAEPVDLNVVVRQSIELLQPMWTVTAVRGPTITARVETGPSAHVEGTPWELREVMINVLLNAVQAMPDGGTLSVRTFVKDEHAWAEVCDTGIGMTDDVRRRLFEPYFTTKRSAGSGLGMSTVAAIVQRHGGVIEVDSRPGHGATVTIGFPLARPTEPCPAPAPVSSTTPTPTSLRVLVVGADARARGALTMALEELGHSVLATADAGEALRTFIDGDFSVVFTDVAVGEVTGWDVAGAVKQIRPAVAVILVAGRADARAVGRAEAAAVDHVLAKPFTLDQIAAVVADAGRRRPVDPQAAALLR